MVTLNILHRILPAYRHSLLVNEKTWITSQTPLYYLDLAVPNEILFKIHFKKLFPNYRAEVGLLGKLEFSKEQRFHPDDTGVGCDGRRDSNSFYRYATAADRKVDAIGMILFLDFFNNFELSLTSGEKAVQFLNLTKLVGYQQCRERIIPASADRPKQLLVNYVFLIVNPSILKGIYKMKSEHPLLVKNLWDLLCLSDKTRLHLFMTVPNAEHLKFMLEEANKINFDFWGMRYGGKGLTEHIWIHYIKEKRLDLVTLMLEYGFALGEMDPENLIFGCCLCHSPLGFFFFGYTCREFIHNGSIVRFLVRCYENCRNLMELPEFIQVFQKVARTLPQPSLPPSIVRMHLQQAFGPEALEAFGQAFDPSSPLVEEVTSIYEACDIHPSDCNVVVPQTLSHLSRYVIRERLAASQQLPTALVNSHLPTVIKSFLCLKF